MTNVPMCDQHHDDSAHFASVPPVDWQRPPLLDGHWAPAARCYSASRRVAADDYYQYR
ncbi:hypothetical protein PY479_07615 [Shewanella sp. A32]|uniref:hypothetical protein n=1 Tax=Shewanella sp. A32 TaxID=3031327 RepID=UPI0023B971CD|nr:hypothetical protein [Shewanella sp. A32]MDF0534140.1 hypothetical protein [Shewanella sp. A32]